MSRYGLFFSKLSYCDLKELKSWTCYLCETDPLEDLFVFTNHLHTDLQSLTAYDPVEERVILAFRGSSSLKNWVQDFRMNQVPLLKQKNCKNCRVHQGFLDSYLDSGPVVKKFYKLIHKYATQNRLKDVLITGHSLGAAVATIAAYHMY
jgi:predicted lipase